MPTLNTATPATAYVSSTAASIFANPTTKNSYLDGILFYNNNSTAEVVEIWNVPNSGGSLGTAADSNKIGEISVAADESVFFPLKVGGLPLALWGTNDAIFAKTTTASKVTQTVFVDTEAE